MVTGLRMMLPDAQALGGFSVHDCVAAMRNLGFFLGSVRRHGSEPVPLVPQAVPVLRELAGRTAMVPRDTVLHYTVWNPTGPRRRRYTDDAQEDHLQESVRIVFADIHHGIGICAELFEPAPEDPAFPVLMNAFADRLASLVDSMRYTHDNVTPRFFAEGLRPYLESVRIEGHDYLGPAAAQLPLWLIDEATWSADRPAPQYEEFWRALVPYGLPRWRDLHPRWDGRASIVTRLLAAAGRDPEQAVLREGAAATVRALRTVVTFRGRHLGIASQVYETPAREFATGSGGGSVELLRDIMDLTKLNARLVHGSPAEPAGRVPLPREPAP
jgi:hypothetical protein